MRGPMRRWARTNLRTGMRSWRNIRRNRTKRVKRSLFLMMERSVRKLFLWRKVKFAILKSLSLILRFQISMLTITILNQKIMTLMN